MEILYSEASLSGVTRFSPVTAKTLGKIIEYNKNIA
jgi:hypothetical protein